MTLAQAKQLYNDGDKEQGRAVLVDYLKASPEDAKAWAYLGAKTTDLEQRKYCYLKSLELADDDTIQARLDKLDEYDPAPPPEFAAKKAVKSVKKATTATTPPPTPKKSNLWLILGVMGGLFLLCVCGCFFIAAISPKPKPTPNPVAAATQPSNAPVATSAPLPVEVPTATPEPPTEVPLQAYKIGDNVTVGEVRWLITEAKDEGQALKSDNQFVEPKTTTGKFLRVSFEVGNLGKEPKSFTGLDVMDSQGRKFQNYSEGLFFIDQSLQCVLKPINPGVSVKCQAIYELPADAVGIKANPGDLAMFGNEEATVDLESVSDAPIAAQAAAAPVDVPTVDPAQMHKIGEKVAVGEVSWLVTEAKDEGQTLKSDNTFIDPKTTGGKFLRVSFEVGNLGKEPKSFTGLDVMDSQGRKFQNYSEGLFFVDQSLQCVFKPINPGVSIKCQAIYELPADAQGIMANPGDLDMLGSNEALIALQ